MVSIQQLPLPIVIGTYLPAKPPFSDTPTLAITPSNTPAEGATVAFTCSYLTAGLEDAAVKVEIGLVNGAAIEDVINGAAADPVVVDGDTKRVTRDYSAIPHDASGQYGCKVTWTFSAGDPVVEQSEQTNIEVAGK